MRIGSLLRSKHGEHQGQVSQTGNHEQIENFLIPGVALVGQFHFFLGFRQQAVISPSS